MDLYILDSGFRQKAYVENYDSAIWSLRYSEYGDFEIHTVYGSPLVDKMFAGEYVLDKQSRTGMFIEDVEINTDTDSLPKIIFKGRSLESILERRIIWGRKKLYGKLQTIVSNLLTESIINPTNSDRRISNFVFRSNSDSRLNEYEIDEHEPLEIDGDNLYDVIKYLCDLFYVGFRVTLDESKQFIFELYCGNNLDGSTETAKKITFSPKFENLNNTRYYQSSQNYKNVNLVTSTYELKAEQNNAEDDPYASSVITAATPSWVKFPTGTALAEGDRISVQFRKKVSAGATLNINGSGAKPIWYNGAAIGADVIDGSTDLIVRYTGGHWLIESLERSDEMVEQRREAVVTSEPYGSALKGVYRRETHTDASGIQTEDGMTPANYIALMQRQGYDILQENRKTTEIDGESIPGVSYIFGRDYYLGDIVVVENECGIRTIVRITEYVQTIDENGPSACPTFSSAYS